MHAWKHYNVMHYIYIATLYYKDTSVLLTLLGDFLASYVAAGAVATKGWLMNVQVYIRNVFDRL